jgi:putative methyltransferase (TIGR04325 family)
LPVPTPADTIPVVLFAYARPAHLKRVLACLRAERVPLVYAFADGAKGAADAAAVAEVRRLLRAFDGGDVRLTERPENLGLGRNVLAGVGEVARAHDTFIVWEDDLVCVPGTYAWMTAALRRYAGEPQVMSVSAWTHPLVTPADAGAAPYFDGRAECWVWGSYARAWGGMEKSALAKLAAAQSRGLAPEAYGADLPRMARAERRRNIWAVRWLYHHFEHGGLCLRPPWSMVEHIGFDEQASNSALAERWANPPLQPAPAVPAAWPAVAEHADCRRLWQSANPAETLAGRIAAKGRSARLRLRRALRSLWHRAVPEPVRRWIRRRSGWRWFRGDYIAWADARAAAGGYDDATILAKVLGSTLAVQAGQAAFERDGVLFDEPSGEAPLLAALEEICGATGGSLRVLDFGGALGSTFWRLRAHLSAGAIRAWDVVEQPAFVAAGRTHLAGSPLRFFTTVGEAETAGPHDVLLCSTTLQYLEHPAEALAAWRALELPFLLLNNLPLHTDGPTRLRVQHVPPSIYPASYPVRFFNRTEFFGWLGDDYRIVREFAGEAVWPVDGGLYPSTGLLLRRKQ